jgi:hypothetical protein
MLKFLSFILCGFSILMCGCGNGSSNQSLLMKKWQYASYSWKYFDDEISTLNKHLADATDSADKKVYADSIKLLNNVLEAAKNVTLQFNKDGTLFMEYPDANGGTEAKKGKWQLFDNGKKLQMIPFYPQNDTLNIKKVTTDTLVITGISGKYAFSVTCKAL